jgi:hypothetical protein
MNDQIELTKIKQWTAGQTGFDAARLYVEDRAMFDTLANLDDTAGDPELDIWVALTRAVKEALLADASTELAPIVPFEKLGQHLADKRSTVFGAAISSETAMQLQQSYPGVVTELPRIFSRPRALRAVRGVRIPGVRESRVV